MHENMKENEFIKVLIELVQKHDCTKVKLLDLVYFLLGKNRKSGKWTMENLISISVSWIRQMIPIITALRMRDSISFITDFCQRIMRILDFEQA